MVPQTPLQALAGSQPPPPPPPPSSIGGRTPAFAGNVNATSRESTSRRAGELHRLGTGTSFAAARRGHLLLGGESPENVAAVSARRDARQPGPDPRGLLIYV